MTPLIVFLLIVIYILLMIISYKPLIHMNKNKWFNHPYVAILLFPTIYFFLIIIALYIGFKYMLNNESNL